MKLAIIIPVYNVAEYLEKCINSVLEQDFTDLEVLLINDGSTDASGSICNSFAMLDSRVRVFHQQNGGVSAARNKGLKEAQGEWICFIDGDDQIEKGALEALMQKVLNGNADVYIAKAYVYANNKKIREKYPFDYSFVGREFEGYELLACKNYKLGSVCQGIFNRRFIEDNNLKFPVGLTNGEDSIFILLSYIYSKRLSFLDIDYYLVRETEGSASRSWNFDRIKMMTNNLGYLNNYIENHTLTTKQTAILNFGKFMVIAVILNKLYDCFSIKNFWVIYRKLQPEFQGKLNVEEIPLEREKIKLINLSLLLFSSLTLVNRFRRNLFRTVS